MSKRLSANQIIDDNITEIKPTRRKKPKKNMIKKVENITLQPIDPLTNNQKKMFRDFFEGFNILADGSAGTGKSFCATYLGLHRYFNNPDIRKVLIVRSAVSVRFQGFVPGTQEEKESLYALPYKSIVNDLCQNGSAWDILTKKGVIEFVTTSYIRSMTFNDCVVIVDEFQNMDDSEMETMVTRLGQNCQVIMCGDTRQDDLARKREKSCYEFITWLAGELPNYFKSTHFDSNDVVRSELCKAIIKVLETRNVPTRKVG